MDIALNIFNGLYTDYYKRLLTYSNSIVRDENRAQEVVQDCFHKLLKQDYSKIETHPVQWLYTVCRNSSIKVLKKNQRYVEAHEHDSIDETRDPSEQLEFQENVKILKKCMKKLSPRQQEVLKFRFFKDLNYEQSAKKMKTTSGNVGFLQSTALKELRALIFQQLNK